MISGAFKRLCGFLARHEQFPTVLISFRYISDTFGYDRCCHVSTTDNDLWVPDSRFGVYSVIGQAGDDLLNGLGAAEMDGSLLPTRERAIDLPPF